MKLNIISGACACLFWVVVCFPASVSAQCELLKRDIEEVRTYAMEVLKISDTLEVFAMKISTAQSYTTARSNARRAEIYSGEILAATYQVVSMSDEALRRAELCGVSGAGEHLSRAGEQASRARDLADQAFGYAKRACATRNLGTMKTLLEKSISAVHEARKAASSVAVSASEAHFCCTPEDIAVAGQGR